jgi:peptidoglycan LD-endopeptidase LytH
MLQLATLSSIFAWALLGGVDAVIKQSPDSELSSASASVEALKPGPVLWMTDADGDGQGDLANPTGGPIRGHDRYGEGEFHASRDGGKRLHLGADYIAAAGDAIRSPVSGTVTRVGYAYRNDHYLRFIEISDTDMHIVSRVLYVAPFVEIGQRVEAGEQIGAAQTLYGRYAGITNHVHVEIDDANGHPLDPAYLLPPANAAYAAAALNIPLRGPAQLAARS